MKNREQFIDLMEEIDSRHLERHIEKNADTRKVRTRRYITSAAIYAAALLAVFLMVPFIINQTGIGHTPGNTPTVPIDTAPTDDSAKETTEPPIMDVEDLIEREGYTLYRLTSEELTGFQNRIEKEKILGKIAVEVTDLTETHVFMEVEDRSGDNELGYLHGTVNRVIVGNSCIDCDLQFTGVYNFVLFQVDGYTVVGKTGVDIALFGGTTSEYHIIKGCDYGYIAPASGKDGMSYELYHKEEVLCYGLHNNKYAMAVNQYEILDIVTSRDEWLSENGTVSVEYNKVTFTPTSEEKIGGDFAKDLEKWFEEARKEVIEMPDGTVYDFTRFDTLDELMAYNRSKIVRLQLDAALDELYNDAVEENGGNAPVYLDAGFLAKNLATNQTALEMLYEGYLDSTHKVIRATLDEIIPAERRLNRRPDWDDGTTQYDGIDGNLYYITDSTVTVEDSAELAHYIECRYAQIKYPAGDLGYGLDMDEMREKYGDIGTVAVYEMGEWYWFETGRDAITEIERFPNYYMVDGIYDKAEGWWNPTFITLNTDLFEEYGMTFAELREKHGNVSDYQKYDGGSHYLLEDGYGYYWFGEGIDPSRLVTDPVTGTEYQMVDDSAICRGISRFSAADMFTIAFDSLTLDEVSQVEGLTLQKTGVNTMVEYTTEYVSVFIYDKWGEDVPIVINHKEKDSIDSDSEVGFYIHPSKIFDINAEKCLLYRLLGMTVEEIEAEFGELEFSAFIAGGTPCYKIPELGIFLEFDKYSDNFDDPLPKDVYPWMVETGSYESSIYPGVCVGMESSNVAKLLGEIELVFGQSDSLTGFGSYYEYGDYSVLIKWSVPEEIYNKTAKAIIWGEEGEGDVAIEELIVGMTSGDVGATVSQIRISKIH